MKVIRNCPAALAEKSRFRIRRTHPRARRLRPVNRPDERTISTSLTLTFVVVDYNTLARRPKN